MIEKFWWKLQDLIDAVLDRMNEDRRWKIIDYLMQKNILKCCRVDGYFWSECIGDSSIFDLGTCSGCFDSPYCYCGKEKPK